MKSEKIKNFKMVLRAIYSQGTKKPDIEMIKTAIIVNFELYDSRTHRSWIKGMIAHGLLNVIDPKNKIYEINEAKIHEETHNNAINVENEYKKIEMLYRKIKDLEDENIRIKRNLMWKIRKLEKDNILHKNEKIRLNNKIKFLKEENKHLKEAIKDSNNSYIII